jgi:hypothetical protein
MRRTLVLPLAVLAFLGVVAPGAYAQAPAAPSPTFKITGFIDELITYSNNTSNYDVDLNRKDYLFYGRTRGRFDIIGQYGKAKAVMGLETDLTYGQTGASDSSIPGPSTSAFGTDGGFDLNTDVRAVLELKWLYTEFEVPYMPYPTVVRLGAQPFGSAANYKLAVYANGDFPGVNIVSTITPNVKAEVTYVAVEENLVGRQQGTASNTFLGISPSQLRGDDYAFILAPEITPMKGLDIKPMYSYFIASGVTNGNARSSRGGIGATTWFETTCQTGGVAWLNGPSCSGNNANGSWRKGIEENRHTVGIDARYRAGGFYLNPTVLYQFGNRSEIAPAFVGAGGLPVQFLDAGVVPGKKYTSDISAWLVDIRGGYQLGPLLLEAMGMYSTGNSARDTTLGTVKYFQPLDTDTSYLADWGGQLTALGIDYLDAMLEQGGANPYPGSAIGWDKYGRIQLGARATYAFTPTLSTYLGWNGHWVPQAIQKNAVPTSGAGLVPLFTGQDANAKSNYIGNELFAGVNWSFAPGLTLSTAGGYMFSGAALDAVTNPTQGPRDAKNVYILTSRVRFSF